MDPFTLREWIHLSSLSNDCWEQFLRRAIVTALLWTIVQDNSLGQLFWTIVRNNHSEWSFWRILVNDPSEELLRALKSSYGPSGIVQRRCSQQWLWTIIQKNSSEGFSGRVLPNRSLEESFQRTPEGSWGLFQTIVQKSSQQLLRDIRNNAQELSMVLRKRCLE